MNHKRTLLVVVVLAQVLAFAVLASSAQAATYYWDTSSSSGLQAGNGTWGVNSYWATDTNGDARTSWVAGSSADFYASGTSTVTVSGLVSVGGITFAGTGYTLTGGTLSVVSGSTITANQNAIINSAIGDNGSIIVAGSATLTVGGIISGNGGSVTENGTGVLVLSGSNTYTGGTTLTAGRLNINNASALGTGTFTISGGTIGNTGGAAITLSTNNAQTWGGDFTFAGTNDLNLGAGAVTMSSSRTVTVASNNLTVGGVISGSGYSLTKAGTGTLVLAGADTYTGGTTISGGTLLLNNAAAVQGSTVTVSTSNGLGFGTGITTFTLGGLAGSSSFALADSTGAGVAVQIGNNNASTSYSGVLSGSGSLTKIGTGALTLAGADTYTGGTTIGGGTLQLGNAAALGPTSDNLAVSGGATLDLHGYSLGVGALSGAGTINNLSGSSTYTLTVGNGNASGTFSGAIKNTTGAIALAKTGTGTLALGGSDTYTGGTTLTAGQLNINSASALGTGLFTISGGTIGNTSGAAITLSTNNCADLGRRFHVRRHERPESRHGRRRDEQQPDRDGRVQQPDGRRRDQRQRLQPHEGGRGHADAHRLRHVYRRDHRQRRHLADRRRRRRRLDQRHQRRDRQRRPGLQPFR